MIRIILAFLNVAGNFFSNAQLFKLCVFQANPPTVERVSLYLWGFTTQVIDKKVLFIIIIIFFPSNLQQLRSFYYDPVPYIDV